jgi:hypothetical protein
MRRVRPSDWMLTEPKVEVRRVRAPRCKSTIGAPRNVPALPRSHTR